MSTHVRFGVNRVNLAMSALLPLYPPKVDVHRKVRHLKGADNGSRGGLIDYGQLRPCAEA